MATREDMLKALTGPPDYFAQVDKIVINGITFNRERGEDNA